MIKKIINFIFPKKDSQEYRFKVFKKYNNKHSESMNKYFKDKYEDERMLVFQLDVLTKAAFNFSFYDTYVTKDEMEKVFEFYNFDEFSRNYLSNLVKEMNKTRKSIK